MSTVELENREARLHAAIPIPYNAQKSEWWREQASKAIAKATRY